MIKFFVIFCLFNLKLFAQTLKPWSTEDEGIRLSTIYPSSLSFDKNLLGLPNVWTSPFVEGKGRSSLSLTITPASSSGWNAELLKKTEAEYQDGRKKWASERNYKIISFLPLSTAKNKNGIPMHTVGLNYEINGVEQMEISIFLEVKTKLAHAKFIGPKSSDQWKQMKTILDELKIIP